jgi:hypothetical protein
VDGSCRFVIVMDVGRWCCRKGNVWTGSFQLIGRDLRTWRSDILANSGASLLKQVCVDANWLDIIVVWRQFVVLDGLRWCGRVIIGDWWLMGADAIVDFYLLLIPPWKLIDLNICLNFSFR